MRKGSSRVKKYCPTNRNAALANSQIPKPQHKKNGIVVPPQVIFLDDEVFQGFFRIVDRMHLHLHRLSSLLVLQNHQ